jgi:DNA topoisomerase-1
VTHGGINATLPKDKAPESTTLDEAIGLLEARAARTDGMPSRRRRPARAEPAHKAPKAAPKSAKAKKTAEASAGAEAKTARKAKARAKQ